MKLYCDSRIRDFANLKKDKDRANLKVPTVSGDFDSNIRNREVGGPQVGTHFGPTWDFAISQPAYVPQLSHF